MSRLSANISTQDIARFMRRIRLEKELPQKQIAFALGVSQSTLSKMERGILEPSAIQWMNFCLFVNVDVGILMKDK
jgi:transcriptional regulator with XRE-family HTH domain